MILTSANNPAKKRLEPPRPRLVAGGSFSLFRVSVVRRLKRRREAIACYRPALATRPRVAPAPPTTYFFLPPFFFLAAFFLATKHLLKVWPSHRCSLHRVARPRATIYKSQPRHSAWNVRAVSGVRIVLRSSKCDARPTMNSSVSCIDASDCRSMLFQSSRCAEISSIGKSKIENVICHLSLVIWNASPHSNDQ
jgi:hypothetical protein